MAELGIAGNDSAAEVATPRLAAIRGAINPTTLVALLLVAVLIFLVANPLFQLVKQSFTNGST
jgi:iron(III) transport system permease protein